ncbi:hypothetical protein BXZ70DRAFT_950979 [Cristinia sonorae]|uniref:Uncharacterized protein n=1 Tax=Cristinia sonorae TaxID=1940300 RepID=A0A8K0XLZ7_9AGAR|nr:hypothetical protein BXZ70DRAFT_950979 [Cristinia sonorae]
MDSFNCPNYLSSRSGDVMISDIRPIKLKLEALRSVNVLLDEFLYNLLRTAGSLHTDRLKTSLIKILPTVVGKESVLEAEMELKAYMERSPQPSPVNGGAIDEAEQFDLQWSYELLRLKCEGYTTLNDSDEDHDAERRLNQRMIAAGGTYPPKANLLAPAALYLTAILEHICGHILSLVSRVVARDSSRAVATVQDLFVALYEDEGSYETFKNMRVYEQIKTLANAQKPRRSKSFSRGGSDKGSLMSKSSAAALNEAVPPSLPSKSRVSSESAQRSSPTTRTSLEKMRAARIFGRSSLDEAPMPMPGRAGTPSEPREGSIDGSIPSDPTEDAALQEEFDELMRSGATMKVSLTPDRLKTMEVYKAERKRQQAQNNGTGPTTADPKRSHPGRKPSIRNVDAIVEDEEDITSPHIPDMASPPPTSFHQPTSRVRQSSLINASSPAVASAANARIRSVSVSAISENAPKKRQEAPPPLPTSFPSTPPKLHRSASARMKMMMTDSPVSGPPRTRRVQRNRESLDLDDVMRGSDDEDDEGPGPLPPPKASSALSPGGGEKKPHISKAARELIDFLDEGPPLQEFGVSPANASMISFGSSKTHKSSRFRSMVSRLTLGGSKENLGRVVVDTPKTPKSASHTNKLTRGPPPPPPPAYLQSSGSLSSKRSIPVMTNVIVGTPPPPPGSLNNSSSSQPPSHSPSPQPSVGDFSRSTSQSHSTSPSPATSPKPNRRLSIVRKAVPAFEGDRVLTPPVIPAEEEPEFYPPSRSPSTVLRVVNGYDDSLSTQNHHQQEPTSTTLASDSTASLSNVSSTPTSAESESLPTPTPKVSAKVDVVILKHVKPRKSFTRENGHIVPVSREDRHVPLPVSTPAAAAPPPRDGLSTAELQDLRKLISVATTADECRLLVDLFLAKHGSLTPTSNPALAAEPVVNADGPDSLEKAVVAVLLGESAEEEEEEEAVAVTEAKVGPVKEVVGETGVVAEEPGVSRKEVEPEVSADETVPAPKAAAPVAQPLPEETPQDLEEEQTVEVNDLRHSWKGVDLL